ncbi:MAG: hypothetical protein JJU28_02725 [Cyclobacteriaceae bacterium]|nr:hypothetical protein [Cyclobacteriaceae bacterium]
MFETGIAQQISKQEIKEVKKSEYLYMLGAGDQQSVAAISRDWFVGNHDKLKILVMDDELNYQDLSRLKDNRKQEILYVFFADGMLHTLEFEEMPDKADHIVIRKHDRATGASQTVFSEKMTFAPEAFAIDMSGVFRNYFSRESARWRRSNIFSHYTSPDQNKILITLNNTYASLPPRVVYTLEYDISQNAGKQGHMRFNDRAERLTVEDVVINNEGEIYTLLSANQSKDFKKRPDQFSYKLYKAKAIDAEVEEISIDSPGSFISNARLTLGENNKPMIAGVYANPENLEIYGTFILNELSGNSIKGKFHALSDVMLEKINEVQSRQKKSDNVNEYNVQQIFAEEDGSCAIFAEHYQRQPVLQAKLSVFSGVTPTVDMADKYKNIIASRFDKNGQLIYTRLIEKSQVSTDELLQFTSFAAVPLKGSYHIFYNDDIKNMTDVKWISIDASGGVSEKIILSKKDDRLRAVPLFAASPGDGIIYLPAIRFNTSHIYKIVLE